MSNTIEQLINDCNNGKYKELSLNDFKNNSKIPSYREYWAAIAPKKPGFYALEFENGVKIGYSKHIFKRMLEYNRPWCKKVVDCFYVIDLESISPRETEEIMKKYIKNIGKESEGDFIVNSNALEILLFFKSVVKELDHTIIYKNKI